MTAESAARSQILLNRRRFGERIKLLREALGTRLPHSASPLMNAESNALVSELLERLAKPSILNVVVSTCLHGLHSKIALSDGDRFVVAPELPIG